MNHEEGTFFKKNNWASLPAGPLLLIDKERMCVCYKHRTLKVLTDLMHIELPNCRAAVISAEDPAFSTYSDMELKLLYLNTSGQKYEMYGREGLIKNLIALFETVPESTLNGFEVGLQADQIGMLDQLEHRYVPGAKSPETFEQDYHPPMLISSAPPVPVLHPNSAPQTAPAPYSAPQTSYKPPAQPKQTIARGERPPSIAMEAPKSGSKTGRVWEIAEKIWIDSGNSTDFKSLRKQIVDACESEGINSSTASVQFGKWKLSKQ